MADAMFPYAHGDPIGALRLLTDGVTGATTLRRVYTAFGQPALSQGSAASRDGYAGAWGYETGLDDGGEPDRPPLPFLHVGERWYDPATGRFLQRDPIGIAGGLNAYAYARADPVTRIDPDGLRDDAAWESYYRWRDELPPDERRDIDIAAGVVGGTAAATATGGTLVLAKAASHAGLTIRCGRWVLVIRHKGGDAYNTTINVINRITGKRHGFGRHADHKGGLWHWDQ